MTISRWIAMSLIVGCCSLARADSAEPKTEELRGGRWVPVQGPVTQPADDPVLRRIEDMIRDGRSRDASKRAVQWLIANPGSPLRDRALYLNAEALFRYGDRVKSFYYLDELMDTYPESSLFYRALEKQFQIANDFLPDEDHRPYKTRFLGLPILEMQNEGIEMLYRIQQRSPGSPLAERALLRTADYYYADEQYDLAADAYAAYVKSYPRSPYVPRLKLRQAYANLAQFRGPRFDATPAIDARAQLTEFAAVYPDLSKEEKVQELIERIDNQLAAKMLATGDFYKRTSKPAAAAYVYRYLMNTYPSSPQARRAESQLNALPAGARDTPPPGGGPVGLPSTQPTAMAR